MIITKLYQKAEDPRRNKSSGVKSFWAHDLHALAISPLVVHPLFSRRPDFDILASAILVEHIPRKQFFIERRITLDTACEHFFAHLILFLTDESGGVVKGSATTLPALN